MDSIIKEAEKALAKYGHFNSTHELYGVLMEEVEEFFDEVKKLTLTPNETMVISPGQTVVRKDKRNRLISELTQIAAIAYRGIKELENDHIKFV